MGTNRLAEAAVELATKNVEIVSGRSAVGHSPVGLLALALARGVGSEGRGNLVLGLVAHLQEALDAAARVLGAHALVPVRQQHHQPRLRAPLLLARRNKVVDYTRSAVHKVAKLGLPANYCKLDAMRKEGKR